MTNRMYDLCRRFNDMVNDHCIRFNHPVRQIGARLVIVNQQGTVLIVGPQATTYNEWYAFRSSLAKKEAVKCLQ